MVENTNTNVLSNLNESFVFYPISIIILLLIIAMTIIYFSPSKITKSEEELISDIYITLSVALLVFTLCVIFLPNFTAIKTMFQQISNVTYVILYTISLIILLTFVPENILNKYAYIIAPFTVILGIFAFYKGATANYLDTLNINYERIKTVILIWCLIMSFIYYYYIDPGNYISAYSSYSILFTILITIFAILYLIVIVAIPEQNINYMASASFGSYFFTFLFFWSIMYYIYPSNVFSNKTTAGSFFILLLIISILWSVLFIAKLFPDITSKMALNINEIKSYRHTLFTLFKIIIVLFLIHWLFYNIEYLAQQYSIFNHLHIFIFALFFIILMYIGYLFVFPYIKELSAYNNFVNFALKEYSNANWSSIIALTIIILCALIFFSGSYLTNLYLLQGGTELIKEPIYANRQLVLGTYDTLNGGNGDEFNYHYAISIWFFIDSSNANNTNNRYVSLLNFGDKPHVLYNGYLKELIITMKSTIKNKNTQGKNEENEENIIYKNDNILLQKWNNIIINYDRGIMDIFLNGELAKSNNGIVPYYTLDNLTIGEENGINGGIKNVIYFKNPLSAINVNVLYKNGNI